MSTPISAILEEDTWYEECPRCQATGLDPGWRSPGWLSSLWRRLRRRQPAPLVLCATCRGACYVKHAHQPEREEDFDQSGGE